MLVNDSHWPKAEMGLDIRMCRANLPVYELHYLSLFEVICRSGIHADYIDRRRLLWGSKAFWLRQFYEPVPHDLAEVSLDDPQTAYDMLIKETRLLKSWTDSRQTGT